MKPTPETDAFVRDHYSQPDPTDCLDLASRFERERDEAREKLEAERALADRLALQLEPLLIFTWRQLPPTKAELAFYAWEEARQSLTPNEKP